MSACVMSWLCAPTCKCTLRRVDSHFRIFLASSVIKSVCIRCMHKTLFIMYTRLPCANLFTIETRFFFNSSHSSDINWFIAKCSFNVPRLKWKLTENRSSCFRGTRQRALEIARPASHVRGCVGAARDYGLVFFQGISLLSIFHTHFFRWSSSEFH